MRCTERETNSALYRERLTVRCTERDLHGAVQRLSLCSTERERLVLGRERLAWCSTETLIMQYRERETSIGQRD